MPENKTIHDLPIAEQTSSSDLFETEIPSQLMQSGFASRKVSAAEIADLLLNDMTYPQALQTTAKKIIPAINEAAQSGGGGGASVVQKTMAEYTALPSTEKMNGSIYKITDKALIYCLDEEYHAVKEITSADYALLTSAEKNNGTLYILTDEETTADDIPYSAGVSVADKIDAVESTILTVHTKTVSIAFDSSGEGSVTDTDIVHIIAVQDMMSDSGVYPAYISYRERNGSWRIKTLSRANLNFTSSGLISQTRTVKIYYLA